MTSAKPSNYINKNIKLRQGTAIYAREQQITTGNSKLRQGTANYAREQQITRQMIQQRSSAVKKWEQNMGSKRKIMHVKNGYFMAAD